MIALAWGTVLASAMPSARGESLAAGCGLPRPWHVSGGDDWPPVPAVYAHRGASALRPEHTLEAYRQAIADGADVIEPDLVITRDGVLVARHENALAVLGPDGHVVEATTDVAERPDYADRRTTKTVDGRRVSGWFAEDFSWAELVTLRARERIPAIRPANARLDGRYGIPSLQQIVDLVRSESTRLGRAIGMAPETKHPTYFQSIGMPLEEPLVALLEANGLNQADAPVVIQSFEVANLQALRQRTPVRLAQLVGARGQPYDFTVAGDSRSYADLLTPEGLAAMRRYADVLAPVKSLVLGPEAVARGGAASELVARAHAADLSVVVWTLRPENAFLPAALKGEPVGDDTVRGRGEAEVAAYLRAGVDGVFADDPGVARRAVDAAAGTAKSAAVAACGSGRR